MTERIAVGIDVVDVPRFARALAAQPRLLGRVFTKAEIEACSVSPNATQRFAARFAAKEALFKALGVGWPQLAYRDVEVVAPNGPPSIRLRADAAGLAGSRDVAVSMSHTPSIAMAEVVLVRAEER